MNVKLLKDARVRFSFSKFAVFPQIPYTQDVLFVLQLSGDKDPNNYYSPMGAANWPTYIENVVLVAAAVAGKVFGMEPYDETKAKKIIAEAIMDLCPAEAKCLFNSAFVEAQEIFVGQPAPSKGASREVLLEACGCKRCKDTVARVFGHEFDDEYRHW